MSHLEQLTKAKKKKLKQLKKQAQTGYERMLQAQEEEVEEVEQMVEEEQYVLQKATEKRGLFTIEKYLKQVEQIDKNLNTIQEQIDKLEISKIASPDPDSISKKIRSLQMKSTIFKEKKQDLLNQIKTLDDARKGKSKVDVEKEVISILKYKGLVKNLDKTIKKLESDIKHIDDVEQVAELKEKLEKYIEKRDEYLELIESLYEDTRNLLQDDEQSVLKLVKEIIKMRDEALEKNQKLSVEKIMNKLNDFKDSDVLSPEAREIFELIFKFKKSQLITFLNLYLKKNKPFFEFLPEYHHKIFEKNKDDLTKLDKNELLQLIKDANFKGDYQKKNKSYLIEILLKKRCDPELDLFCASDEVCDIENEVCIPKPEVIREKYGIKMFKGNYLYGPYKELNNYIKSLYDMVKLERQRIKSLETKNTVRTYFEKDLVKRTTKYLDIAGQEIYPVMRGYTPKISQTFSFYTNITCLNDYEKKPWIENYSQTYIMNIDGSKPNSKFIVTSDEIEYKDNTYYKVNRVFNLLNCNKYQKDRKQEEDVLTLFDEKGNELKFKLLHRLSSGQYLKQTEELFEKEKKWIALYTQSVLEKLNFYLGYNFNNSSLNGIIRTKVLNVLESLLLQNYIFNEIEQNIKQLYPNYLDKVILSLTYDVFRGISTKERIEQKIDVEQIKNDVTNKHKKEVSRIASEIESGIRNSIFENDTIGDYLRKMSDIIIYLDSNIKLFQLSRTFVNKILNHYYKYSLLGNLNIEDKIIEIFKNPNIDEETKLKLMQIVGNEIENRTLEIINSVLNMLEPTAKSIDLSRSLKPVNYQEVLDLVPVKADEMDQGASWEYEYYFENGKIYAFNIFSLLDNFLNKNYKNPFTNNDFDESFIKDILSKYSLSNIIFGDDIDPSDEYILIQENENKKEDVTKIVYDLLERAITLDEQSDIVVEEEILYENPDENLDEIEDINLDENVLENIEEDEIEIEDVKDEIEDDDNIIVDNDEDLVRILRSFHSFVKSYFLIEEDKDVNIENFVKTYNKDNEALVEFFNYLEQNYYPEIGYEDSANIIDKFIDNQLGDNEVKKDEEFCDYCKKRLAEEIFKSAVKKSQGSEIVKFCSLKCMEESPFRKRS